MIFSLCYSYGSKLLGNQRWVLLLTVIHCCQCYDDDVKQNRPIRKNGSFSFQLKVSSKTTFVLYFLFDREKCSTRTEAVSAHLKGCLVSLWRINKASCLLSTSGMLPMTAAAFIRQENYVLF